MSNETRHVPLFERPFYFLRHGESEGNQQKIVAGTLDVSLNEAGRAQAHAAIEPVRAAGITHVTSSALSRARDTAAIIAAALQVPHAVVTGLGERNWGELEGQPQASRQRGVLPPGAETVEQFVARTRAALAQVDARGTPLVVAHSGTFRALCRLLAMEEPAGPVANCRLVPFTPPARAGEGWSMVIVQK